MSETMQVVQIEIYLNNGNECMQDDIETIMRETANVPSTIACKRHSTNCLNWFGFLDNLTYPIDAKLVEKAFAQIKSVYSGDVLLCNAWIWEMDVDEPTYEVHN